MCPKNILTHVPLDDLGKATETETRKIDNGLNQYELNNKLNQDELKQDNLNQVGSNHDRKTNDLFEATLETGTDRSDDIEMTETKNGNETKTNETEDN